MIFHKGDDSNPVESSNQYIVRRQLRMVLHQNLFNEKLIRYGTIT